MQAILRTALVVVILLVGTSPVHAQAAAGASSALSRVTYPVAVLGGCESREACKLYCDVEANRSACFAYAQEAGLMTKGAVKAAVAVLSKKGPGNCSGKAACVEYCSDTSHQSECLSFAQSYQLVSEERAILIKKLIRGEAPGACKSGETCRMYCADPAHQDECRSFAETEGLMRTASSSPRSQAVQEVLASTSPGHERGMELNTINRVGTSTPPGALKKPLPPKSAPAVGASVWHGFLRLIGI